MSRCSALSWGGPREAAAAGAGAPRHRCRGRSRAHRAAGATRRATSCWRGTHGRCRRRPGANRVAAWPLARPRRPENEQRCLHGVPGSSSSTDLPHYIANLRGGATRPSRRLVVGTGCGWRPKTPRWLCGSFLIQRGNKQAPMGESLRHAHAVSLPQKSALPGWRGNGITSRMFSTPVQNCTSRSNPNPKPACGTAHPPPHPLYR
jgi:hypothetical protein